MSFVLEGKDAEAYLKEIKRNKSQEEINAHIEFLKNCIDTYEHYKNKSKDKKERKLLIAPDFVQNHKDNIYILDKDGRHLMIGNPKMNIWQLGSDFIHTKESLEPCGFKRITWDKVPVGGFVVTRSYHNDIGDYNLKAHNDEAYFCIRNLSKLMFNYYSRAVFKDDDFCLQVVPLSEADVYEDEVE